VSLLAGGGDDGDQGGAQLLELQLGLGVEERQGGEVDRLGGVLGVEGNGGAGSGALAAVADANLAKEVLGVLQVGVLLGAAEALTALSLGLLLILLVRLGGAAGTLGLVLCDALALGLLVGGGGGGGLGLGLLGLLSLLTLCLGVIGGIPGVEDLSIFSVSRGVGGDGRGRCRGAVSSYIVIVLLVLKLAASDRSGGGGRVGSGAAAVALLLVPLFLGRHDVGWWCCEHDSDNRCSCK
jgi:hypothetical protein